MHKFVIFLYTYTFCYRLLLFFFHFRLVYHGPTYVGFPLLLCPNRTWVDFTPTMSHLDCVSEWECLLSDNQNNLLSLLLSPHQPEVSVANLARSHRTSPNLDEVQLSSDFSQHGRPGKVFWKIRLKGQGLMLSKRVSLENVMECVQIPYNV